MESYGPQESRSRPAAYSVVCLNPHRQSVSQLPVERIAITVPPRGWFHGISFAIHKLHRQALVDLGLRIFDMPVEAFLSPEASRIATLIQDLRSFRPQIALASRTPRMG